MSVFGSVPELKPNLYRCCIAPLLARARSLHDGISIHSVPVAARDTYLAVIGATKGISAYRKKSGLLD